MANTSRGRFTPPMMTTRAKHTRETTPTSPSSGFTNKTVPPRHLRCRAASAATRVGHPRHEGRKMKRALIGGLAALVMA